MKIESADITTLHPDPQNARKHPQQNLDAIKASLERFGQQKPIVADTAGRVIAGHGTLAAAQALGWTKISIVRTTLSGTAATAYALADNRTADLAEWHVPLLAQQLASLQINDDTAALAAGFSDDETEKIIDQATGLKPDNDPTPDLPAKLPGELPGELPGVFQVLAACNDEPAQRLLYDRLTQEGYPCRVLTL